MSSRQEAGLEYANWLAILDACLDPQKGPSIVEVSFNHKKLREFPLEILQCSGLKRLSLQGNLLTDISPLEGAKSLTELNVGENQLETVPAGIGKLAELRILFLDKNKLQAVPQAIGSLERLAVLGLTGNRIRKLGRVCECPRLRETKPPTRRPAACWPPMSRLLRSLAH